MRQSGDSDFHVSPEKVQADSPSPGQAPLFQGMSSMDGHPDGWHSVPRLGSPPPPETAEWEMLSPGQMSRAGSTPRSLSTADLLEPSEQPGEEDLAPKRKSASASTNEAMATAEAATASVLLPGTSSRPQQQQQQRQDSQPVPIPSAHADAESDSTSDACSDRVMSLGALLPEGFRLREDEVQPGRHDSPPGRQPQLTRLTAEHGSQVPGWPVSEQGGSFASLSAPASLMSFDFANASAPGSPGSEHDDSQDADMWLEQQAETGQLDMSPPSPSATSQDVHQLSPEDSGHLSADIHETVRQEAGGKSAFASSDGPAAMGMAVQQDHSGSALHAAKEEPSIAADSEDEAFPVLPGSKAAGKEEQDLPPAAGIYASLSGAAVATCSLANGVWRWLQDFVGRLPGLVPAQARAAVARAVGSLRGTDRSIMLGVGLAVVGALYAGTVVHNRRLSRALIAKDRDMGQLVMKVFNLQHTIQSSRSIPIVRHTSTTCSFSFAGGAVTAV